MRSWLRDTLFKRLFVLMWLALVASHLAAFLVVVNAPSTGPGPHSGSPRAPRGLPPPHAVGGVVAPDAASGVLPPPPRAGAMPMPTLPSLPPTPGLPGDGARGLPPLALALDYGVRLLLIALAAWLGARWLSAPMRRLAEAARALGHALDRHGPLPRLDEARGTVEVREAARVFNEMAGRLDHQFKARGLLVAAISHDLRTPLTRLRMRLEALQDHPAAQRGIGDVREMDELIDAALGLFRDDGLVEPPRRTDLCALVQALADDFAEQGRSVQFRGQPVLALVQPALLRRVLGNLIDNALRYGGAAEVTVHTDGRRAFVRIDDRGPGIPEAELEAMFEPFRRGEASRSRDSGGAGLGLYIARDLALRQNGSLTLANREGGGLRAELELRPA